MVRKTDLSLGILFSPVSVPASQWNLAGTDFHCLASATIAPASKTPKPNRWLNSSPTPFIVQKNLFLASNREFLLEVSTVRCCMSLQVRSRLASSARANTPAASGAAADVPECVLVHLPFRSVVATPVLGSLAPFENVEASVEEQLSS